MEINIYLLMIGMGIGVVLYLIINAWAKSLINKIPQERINKIVEAFFK